MKTWIVTAKCCREYKLLMPYPWRKCKFCGEKPVVVEKELK